MAGTPLPTMNDVAARAGCARATVSLALRSDPRITVATRQRVLAAARELDYQPNPLVAALMTTRRMRRVTARRSGGDAETVPPSFPEATLHTEGPHARIRAPARPGAYRLFLFVRDGAGGGATENFPLWVQP